MAKQLALHVRHLPDFKNARVLVRQVERRSIGGIDCFVVTGDDFETIQLPNDFWMREFMSVNPKDERQLLEFQRQYGIVKSSLALNALTAFPSISEAASAAFWSIASANPNLQLADEISARETTNQVLRSMKWNYFKESGFRDYVSLEEASACVTNMQTLTKVLLYVAKNGTTDEDGNGYYLAADEAVGYISSYIDKAFPTISLRSVADIQYGGFDVSIMAMIAAQCLYGIQTHERGKYVFKTCSHCKKPFQFGRKSSSGDGVYLPRPIGTDYCSPKCQKDFNKHGVSKDGNKY